MILIILILIILLFSNRSNCYNNDVISKTINILNLFLRAIFIFFIIYLVLHFGTRYFYPNLIMYPFFTRGIGRFFIGC